MTLDTLLEPFHEVDQEILSYYAKAVEKFTGGNFNSKYITAMSLFFNKSALRRYSASKIRG